MVKYLLTADSVRELLRQECAKAGGISAWGRRHKVSYPYIQNVLRGETPPGPKIASALGFKRVVLYISRSS